MLDAQLHKMFQKIFLILKKVYNLSRNNQGGTYEH